MYKIDTVIAGNRVLGDTKYKTRDDAAAHILSVIDGKWAQHVDLDGSTFVLRTDDIDGFYIVPVAEETIAEPVTAANIAPSDWLFLICGPAAEDGPAPHYLGIGPGGRFFFHGVEVETDTGARDALVFLSRQIAELAGVDLGGDDAIQNREIERLRGWLAALGDLADVDADNRGWMVRDALAGARAPVSPA